MVTPDPGFRDVKPGIDPTILRRVLGDDPGLLREVVEDFLPVARSGVADIRAAAAGGIAEEVRQASHRLKGSSSLVGAGALTEACAAIEAAAHRADWQAIQTFLPLLDGLMSDIEASANALLRSETR
jgi:HPt (histidine-containing phosphotransfer) domain-containing protein